MESFENTMLSSSQAKVMLMELACSSVMRLDNTSMDKLQDLMVMIYKWQMFLLNIPEDLLNLTMKHLDCIGKIYPDLKKMVLIDEAKQTILNHWDSLDEDHKYVVARIINKWLSPFSTKISLLIRAKLQNGDGTFLDKTEAQNNSFFNYYSKNNGENIYEIVTNFNHQESPTTSKSIIDQLFNQLNMEVEKCNLLGSFPAAFKPRKSLETDNRINETDLEETTTQEEPAPEKSEVQIEHSSNISNLLEELKLNSDALENTDEVKNEFSELLDMLNK
jgi:hypothetical protein